jgi:hypothetical protein
MGRALRFCLPGSRFSIFCLVGLALVGLVLPRFAFAALRLNEILPAPASDWDGDQQTDSKKDEWVEIVNTGAEGAGLEGILLLSGESRVPVYGFSGTLPAGACLAVRGSEAVAWESGHGQSAIGLSLNNSGDMVWLVRISGADTVLVDSLSFSSSEVGYDVSLGRLPDGSGGLVAFDHFQPMGGLGVDPSPGLSNAADPAPHIMTVSRDPLSATADDSVRITVKAGDATGISQAVLAYQINLENGEDLEMTRASGTPDLGVWTFSIPPCAPGDTVRYKILLHDPRSLTETPWAGYRVRSGGVGIRLNEMLADPPDGEAGDANRDGIRDSADDEFIEIVNCGPDPIDVSGWKLADATSVRHVFPDTGSVIMSGEFVTVFGGGAPSGFAGKVFTASSGGLGLTNAGDAISLLDRAGALVDIHSYGGEGNKNQAMMRHPDCSGDWVLPSDVGLGYAFTPQASNGGGNAVAPTTWGTIKGLYK